MCGWYDAKERIVSAADSGYTGLGSLIAYQSDVIMPFVMDYCLVLDNMFVLQQNHVFEVQGI